MNAVECLLKSENFSVAAQLDPWSPDAPVWLKLAADWRIRALKDRDLKRGNRMLLERQGEIEMWDAIAAPGVSSH